MTGQPGQGQGWDRPSGSPGPGWAAPSGAPGYPPPPYGLPNPSGSPRRRGRAVWWGAGLALVAVLAGGGAIAATQLASSTSSVPPGPTGQAAELNTMLNSASSPASAAEAASFGASSPANAASRCESRAAKVKAAGFPGLAGVVLRRCRHPLARVRALGGIHGQFTFETASGPRTLAYERGVVQLVTGTDVVVQAKDGTSLTWVLESNTVIRQDHKQVAASALSVGEQVFAAGPVVSGDYDARLIVIRPASSSSSGSSNSPSPTPSPAAGS